MEAPDRIVDIHRLPELVHIAVEGDELVIGAGARMSHVSAHPDVQRVCPAISEALWRSASQQLRNMATIGGNLMQRTRCPYFRAGAPYACNKREPGSGCSAIGGVEGVPAVMGVSDHCVAIYPGDLGIALAAFDATVDVIGPQGARSLPFVELNLLPGSTPEREHALHPGEIITAVRVPVTPVAAASAYLKIRPRESYAFALASAAVGVLTGDDGRVTDCRIGIGGVSTTPVRAAEAERSLIGEPLTGRTARAAGEIALRGARPGYQSELGTRTVAEALLSVGRSA